MASNFTDSLPTGWEPQPSRSKFYSVHLIVVFSVMLAVAITLVITGAVLCHKHRPPPPDVERAKHAPARADDRRRAAAKRDKMWARWRRTARAGLRRRRRVPGGRQPEQDALEHSTDPGASFSSLIAEPSADPPRVPEDSPVHDGDPRDPPPPRAVSPPAYGHISPARRRSSRGAAHPTKADAPRAEGSGSAQSPIVLAPDPDEPAPAAQGAGAGASEPGALQVRAHVATDDKEVLERMRRCASEPHAGAGADAACAPVWQDERLEDFPDEREAGPSSAPHPRFELRLPPPPPPPPPPDTALDVDPALPYYVPRFEPGGASEPPCEDHGVGAGVPSAPPLDDDGDAEGGAASAPPPDRARPPGQMLPRYEP